jgi:hypothetical protein
MGEADNAKSGDEGSRLKAQLQQLTDHHFNKFQELCMNPEFFRMEAVYLMRAPLKKLNAYRERLNSDNRMTEETLLEELAPVCDYVTKKMLEAPEPLRQAFMNTILDIAVAKINADDDSFKESESEKVTLITFKITCSYAWVNFEFCCTYIELFEQLSEQGIVQRVCRQCSRCLRSVSAKGEGVVHLGEVHGSSS